MQAPGWPITLLMGHFFGSGGRSKHKAPLFPVSIFIHAAHIPSQLSTPFPTPLTSLPAPSASILSSILPYSSNSAEPIENASCSLTISPSALVIRFGDPVTANCSLSGVGFSLLGWEVPMATPQPTINRFLVWSVDRIDQWNIKPTCYALCEQGGKCDIELPVIVYKPPLRVSISFSDDSGMMIDGDQYILRCTVHDVAPVEKLIVNFYREHMILGQLQSNNTRKSLMTEVFTLNFQPSKVDDKAQYWCEARLELGPEGPQPPPVIASKKLTAKVLYGPHLICPRKLKVKEGEGLKCEVMGNPHPLVTWIRDGQVVDLPAHSQIEHAGKYTAWTIGLFGENNFTVEVEVIVNSGKTNIPNGHFSITLLLIQIFTQL